MNKADVQEFAELDLWKYLEECHKKGLSYRLLLKICLIACEELAMKAEVESRMRKP